MIKKILFSIQSIKFSGFRKYWRGIFLILFSLLMFSFCTSKYQKLLQGSDYNLKLETAIKYYEKQDYYRALQLLEELITLFRGTDKAEKVYYYYAYCHYGQGDYILASYHFKNYYTTFPKGAKATECLYMSAYCKYLDSPYYGLDQTSTNEAIKELQFFINRYPTNDSAAHCTALIDELRLKLKKKAFEQAKLYYKIRDYKAAVRSLKNVIKDYPDISNKEEILYLILKANYEYALNSINEKKKERYDEVIKAYNELILAFPETIYFKEATTIFKNSSEEINKFATPNS